MKAPFTEEAAGRPDRCSPPAACPQASRPGKPSTPGTRRRPPSGVRPSRHANPWNGSSAGRTWSSAVPPAPAKTFLREALGHQAVEAGMRVAWYRLEDLGVLIRAHCPADSVTRAATRILRAEVVVTDDIGLMPMSLSPVAPDGTFRSSTGLHERRAGLIQRLLIRPGGGWRIVDNQRGGCVHHERRRPADGRTTPGSPGRDMTGRSRGGKGHVDPRRALCSLHLGRFPEDPGAMKSAGKKVDFDVRAAYPGHPAWTSPFAAGLTSAESRVAGSWSARTRFVQFRDDRHFVGAY